MSETKKYWLVKYALSNGLKEITGKSEWSEKYVTSISGMNYRIGRDVVATRTEAAAIADAMRIKKIASLRKQIAKLEAMTFSLSAKGEK